MSLSKKIKVLTFLIAYRELSENCLEAHYGKKDFAKNLIYRLFQSIEILFAI